MLVVSICLAAVGPAFASEGTLFLPSGANFSVYSRGADTFILNQSRMVQLKIDRQMAQLSTGKRILSAADDPAGLAAAEKMESLLRGLKQDAMNDEDWKNYCSFAEAMAGQNQEIVHRIRELISRANGAVLGPDDRQIIQDEIAQMLAQIDANAVSKLNRAQVIPELTAESLGLSAIDVVRNANGALGIADRALLMLTRKRVLEGTKSSVITFRIEGKAYHYVNQLASQSRITDQDMAEGVSDLMRNSIILQTGQGLLLQSK